MKLRALLAISLYFAAGSVMAAGSGSGLISQPLGIAPSAITPNVNVFTFKTASIAGSPSCNSQARWAVNATTAGGAAIMKVVLTAFALGKTINVAGDGSCSAYSDSETAAYAYITN